MKKNDIFLIVGIFFCAVILLGVYIWTGTKSSKPALEITVADQVFGIYPLEQDRVIRINDTNVCRISKGKAAMTEADCPDQQCVHSREIGSSGGSIVCLPNRVVLKIIDEDKDQDTYDAIAG